MCPLFSFPGRGPTPRLGSGRHWKRGGGEGGGREKAGVGWGPSVPPACARVCATQVRGRKLLLLSRQLCQSRRQSRARPGPGPDFSSRWSSRAQAQGLQRRALCGRAQSGTPLPLGPLRPRKYLPHHPTRLALKGQEKHL